MTNITQDHLDYFKTFEAYEKTKLSFLTSEHIKQGVVCVDDPSARKLIGNTDVPVLTYGLYNPCDAFAIDVCCSMNGSHFVGNVCDSVVDIKTNLVGEYNVYNSLAALTVCHCLGLDEKQLEMMAKRRNCDGIIAGHIHQGADKMIGPTRYLNCGDWVESLSAVIEEHDGTMRLIHYDEWMRRLTVEHAEACFSEHVERTPNAE